MDEREAGGSQRTSPFKDIRRSLRSLLRGVGDEPKRNYDEFDCTECVVDDEELVVKIDPHLTPYDGEGDDGLDDLFPLWDDRPNGSEDEPWEDEFAAPIEPEDGKLDENREADVTSCANCGQSEGHSTVRYGSSHKDLEDAWQDVLRKMSPLLDNRCETLRMARRFPKGDVQRGIILAFERLLRLERELAVAHSEKMTGNAETSVSPAYGDLSAFVATLLTAVGLSEKEELRHYVDDENPSDLLTRVREISHRSCVSEVEKLSGILSSMVSLMMRTTNALHANSRGEGLGLLIMAGQGEEYRKALMKFLDDDQRLEASVQPKRLATVLVSEGFSPALRDVAKMSAVEFLSIHGVGKASLNGVVAQLDEIGVQSVLGSSAKYMGNVRETIDSLQQDDILDADGRLCGDAGAVADRMLTNALYGTPEAWVIRTGKNNLSVRALRETAIENAQRDLRQLLSDAGLTHI